LARVAAVFEAKVENADIVGLTEVYSVTRCFVKNAQFYFNNRPKGSIAK
jgi:hypothetical protein